MNAVRNRIFHAWFRFSRPKTLGVRAIVENAAGQILLVRHTYTKGLFFPGGGVEKDEAAHTSLLRELEEEGGVRITGAPSLIGIFANQRHFRNDHVLLYRLGSDEWMPCPATSRGEISEVIWCDPLDPHADTTDATKRRLDEVYRGAETDPLW